MVEDNLKDFVVNFIITGLLFFSLISFASLFMFSNNPTGLTEDELSMFNKTANNMSSKLLRVSDDSDRILNITSNTNPEAGDLGSRDSVASAFETKKTAIGFWDSSKIILRWIFTGDAGKMILASFGGIIGFLAIYFVVKWIRNGI